MNEFGERFDLALFYDQQLLDRQNRLKAQILEVLEAVSNEFPQKSLLDIDAQSKGSKISKGNDLMGSPYMVLDFIRNFDNAEGINVRLLVWWGKGCFLMAFVGKNLPLNPESFVKEEFQLALGQDKWDLNDLIINKNKTGQVNLQLWQSRVHILWIKELNLSESSEVNQNRFILELKKVFSILKSEL